jgi:hypothetical protein
VGGNIVSSIPGSSGGDTIGDDMTKREYLLAAVDRLQVVLAAGGSGTPAVDIVSEVMGRYPAEGRALVEYLVLQGTRRAWESGEHVDIVRQALDAGVVTAAQVLDLD